MYHDALVHPDATYEFLIVVDVSLKFRLGRLKRSKVSQNVKPGWRRELQLSWPRAPNNTLDDMFNSCFGGFVVSFGWLWWEIRDGGTQPYQAKRMLINLCIQQK